MSSYKECEKENTEKGVRHRLKRQCLTPLFIIFVHFSRLRVPSIILLFLKL
jgi:hypothetical protein